jgi:alkanesulfonate monooxygenase SsuD/methylene tetrahydromethanopterin reductase-like flavin-dependent oxidoreductase (luciferase family)
MLATRLEPTKLSFDYYREVAAREGYEAGPEHIGYLFKVHVDETEELAYETGKKFLEGPGNIFLEGSRGTTSPVIQALPGLTDRNNLLPTGSVGIAATSRGHTTPVGDGAKLSPEGAVKDSARSWAQQANYDEQLENYTMITGTPKTVIPKIRHVMETLRPGTIFFWDGDGAMTHEDSMRSLKLFGSDVLPAVREIGDELGLKGPFESNPWDAPAIPESALPEAAAPSVEAYRRREPRCPKPPRTPSPLAPTSS